MEKRIKALERLHDEYRKDNKKKKEITEEEWLRLQRTGGGCES
tara:strand:+ start:3170 stop:3298 length:129 start_codon:yes stop_codon:yes gene_type:complete